MKKLTKLIQSFFILTALMFSLSSHAGVIQGSKWGDPALSTPGGEVTWSLMGSGFSCDFIEPAPCTTSALSNFMPSGFITEIETAFNTWSSFADITFKMIADGGESFGAPADADIRITGHQFDGMFGDLAHAYYPEGFNISGDIHFDVGDTWGINTAGTFDIFSVALHEIGHSIGLGHSTNSAAVMFAQYNGVKLGLDIDDITTVQAIYGAAPLQVPLPVPEPSSLVLFMSIIGLLFAKKCSKKRTKK